MREHVAGAVREEHLQMAKQLPYIGCKFCPQGRTTINKEFASMKRFAFIAAVICLSASFVKAQETSTPVFEVGANYSFVHVTSPQNPNTYGENGGSAYVAYNVNRAFGLVADLGGYDSRNLGVH